MKLKRVGFLLVSFLISCSLNGAITYFSPRSQSASAEQQLIDMTMIYHIHEYSDDGLRGTFTLTPEYTRSFRSDDLVCCLIGKNCLSDPDDDRCCNNSIYISGSRVPDRNRHDWLADYFGLPPDFQSKVMLTPKVDNFLVHMNLFVPLGCSELFFRIYSPIVHTRWRLDLCEQIVDSGELGYDAGYFDTVAIPRENLLGSFEEFIGKEQVPSLENVTFRPLEHGKWLSSQCNRLSKTGLSDVMVFLGCNFFHDDAYHLSLAALGIIPTGNRPRGDFFFEPVVGNGKHGGIGGSLSAHYLFWEDECCESSFGIYVYGWGAHLFKATQCRTFDLINGCNSRYILAEKVTPPVDPNLWANPLSGNQAGSTQPIAQFKSVFTSVANLTHRKVTVDVAAYGEAAVLLNYTTGGFSFDLGYNYWGRSCEKICLDKECCTNSLLFEQWALKGDAHVFGFSATGPTCPTGVIAPTGPCLDLPIALSATQSEATLMSGLNNFVGPDPDQGGIGGIRPTRNPGVDNDQFARLVQGADPNAFILDRLVSDGGLQTKTSLEPILLSDKDIDICAATTQGSSHSIFAHLGYAWLEEECWIPFVGIGVKAEWARKDKNCNTDDCTIATSILDSPPDDSMCQPCTSRACTNCALSQWSVWVKAGITFH